MELNDLLGILEKVSANLQKLERVWQLAEPYVPSDVTGGTSPEYENLRRQWQTLLSGLPPIDGWRITDELPDAHELGMLFLQHGEMGEPPIRAMQIAQQPAEDLGRYRYLLDRARRDAIAQRLTGLAETITEAIEDVLTNLPSREAWEADESPSFERIDTPRTQEIEQALTEIGRLLGDTVERKGRWGDMYRHLRFGQTHDWLDIAEADWPSVRIDIEAAMIGESDPIPVPEIDLGAASASRLSGGATTKLNWLALSPDGFERLLFDILKGLDGYQNVKWLMKTNAPDNGRDLSLEQISKSPTGSTHTERVILQAKHYTSKSVGPLDISESLASLSAWEPPVIRRLIIATSGRFSATAVSVAEKHNDLGNRPYIELWPDNVLESLLDQRPGLAMTYGLRN